ESDGRPFRWTAGAAALRVDAPAGRRSLLRLPLRNARPDGQALSVTFYWNDGLRGTVDLPHGGWKTVQLGIDGPGILRVVPSRTFSPFSRTDGRRLGVETGPPHVLP
ncbi:MAG: hypothetical protein KJ062_06565, partial [Thermoanaerobaculia bacterium]|nr:hypothetical protein [Thermoanaerobaculia bacterium]